MKYCNTISQAILTNQDLSACLLRSFERSRSRVGARERDSFDTSFFVLIFTYNFYTWQIAEVENINTCFQAINAILTGD